MEQLALVRSIGALLVAVPLVAVIVFLVKYIGWKGVLHVTLLTLAIMFFITLGLYLLGWL